MTQAHQRLRIKQSEIVCYKTDCSEFSIAKGLCWKHYMRRRRANAPTERNQTKERESHLRRTYAMSLAQFQARLDAQGGRCANPGCRAAEPGGKGSWHVDHDHSCCSGKTSCGDCVRGLLCSRCNVTAGHAKDNPQILRGLADYLTRSGDLI